MVLRIIDGFRDRMRNLGTELEWLIDAEQFVIEYFESGYVGRLWHVRLSGGLWLRR
jgi:hypothetical protein